MGLHVSSRNRAAGIPAFVTAYGRDSKRVGAPAIPEHFDRLVSNSLAAPDGLVA